MEDGTERLRHPDLLRQAFLWALLPTFVLFLITPSVSDAQEVTTSITPTIGTGDLGTTVTHTGAHLYDIGGGTRSGDGTGPNLFHSFGDFSVGQSLGQSDIANFFNDSGLSTTNIIGRVTGGNPSSIDGIIQTTGFGNANLFLVNPFGIVFGPHGSFDVGGSVSFSTAQYVRLFNSLIGASANFYANPASDGLANSVFPVFAMAPVDAFGFLPSAYGFLTAPDPSATITVQGSGLSVSPGQSISLVGGNISIQGASLSAPGGQLNLVSVASPGEVLVPSLQTGPEINGASFTTMGTVTLEGATLDVSGQFEVDGDGHPIGGNSGTVFVRGGQLVMDASFIFANTVGPVDGAPTAVDIQVSQDVALTNGALILTETSGAGRGGDVHITADSLTLDNASTIATLSLFGDGVGGDLLLNVGKTFSLLGGSLIQSTTVNDGTDLDGDGVVDVIRSKGGNVTVQGILQGPESVAGSVVLSGGSQINSETDANGPGGQISITAKSIAMDEPATAITTSTFGIGLGGNVVLGVQQLSMTGGASIRSHTDSADPDAAAGGTITVQGLPGEIMADSLTIAGPDSGIIANTFGNARLGDLVVHAKTVSLTDEAVIQAGTPFDTGTGGNVTIDADSIGISGGSSISSQAYAIDAGQVTITANNALTLDNGSIVTKSFDGIGGNVVLNVRTVSLTNGASIDSKTISTNRAGDITMNIGTLTLSNGAEISSNSADTASGDAGNVTIQGPDGPGTSATSVTLTNSSLLTNTEGAGAGGNITVAVGSFTLNNASKVSAATAGPKDAGQVIVTTPTLSLDNATITTSTSSSGNAGDLTTNVGTLALSNGAEISSNSGATASGNAGIVTIQGRDGDGTLATSVTLTNSSLLTNTEGTGAGGDIRIHAGQVQLADLALLTADTIGTGKAGSIEVTSDSLSVTGGARIQASTAGAGNAGDITITNSDTVSITGLSSDGSTRSGIFAKTQSSGGITGPGGGGGSGGGGSSQPSTPGDAGNIVMTTKNLFLSGGGQIDSSTTTSGSGGSVSVRADAITITGTSTSLRSDASRGNGTGGDIELGARTIGIHDKASVTAATDGSGDAGNISMTATESLTLDSAAIITTSTRGSGSGGAIFIDSPQVLVDGPGTSITASTLRPFADLAVTLNIVHPNDGDLTVRLDSPDGTRVALLSRVGGSGDNFTGTTFDDLATRPIPTTSSSAPFTSTFMPREPLGQLIDQTVAGTWKLNINDQVAGNAGVLQNLTGWSLRVGDHVFESTNVPRNIPDGGSVSSSLVVTVPAGTVVQGVGEAPGAGGNIMINPINAGTVTVQNGATVSATTRGSGQGGTVNVNSTGLVLTGPGTGLFTNSEASGRSGDINVTASSMTLDNGAKVSAASSGTGNAGQVIVTTPTLSLDNATITTSTSSSGNAGDLTANVGTLTLSNGAEISSSGTGTASGNAGSITIQGLVSPANSVTITGSSLLTSAANTGQGGSVTVSATNLALNNATVSASVNNFDNSPGSTDGATVGLGNVDLTASTMTMTGSTVTTESSGARNAGDIKINPDVAGNSFQMQNSTINTSAALADGGNIEINATYMVRLTDSIITSSVGNETKTDTLGGNVKIDPQFVILQNSQIRANAFAGSGGAINIIATSAFIADPLSIVDASSTKGISGTVNIQAPLQNVGGELTALTQEFSSAAALLAQQCAARAADGKFSTFVVAAREGLPGEPGGFLASPSLTTAELLGSRLSGRDPQTQLLAVTGLFPKYDTRPIQLARFGEACHRQ